MKNYKIITVETNELIGFTCDKCKTFFDIDNWIAHDEMHTISFIGGYGSVFGDAAHIDCDLCQQCLHELIKDFVRISYGE